MSEINTLPVLPLRDIVVFPQGVAPLFVGREKSVRALEEVMRGDKQILLATQRDRDMDDPTPKDTFDVGVIAKATLKNKVERLLRSPLIATPLKSQGIEIGDISATKQTETTQRWKVGLRRGDAQPLRTKLEFSRRDAIQQAPFAAIDREVLRPYGLTPFLATP